MEPSAIICFASLVSSLKTICDGLSWVSWKTGRNAELRTGQVCIGIAGKHVAPPQSGLVMVALVECKRLHQLNCTCGGLWPPTTWVLDGFGTYPYGL